MPRLKGIINAFATILLVVLVLVCALYAIELFITPPESRSSPEVYLFVGTATLLAALLAWLTRPARPAAAGGAKPEKTGTRIAKGLLLALGAILLAFFLALIFH